MWDNHITLISSPAPSCRVAHVHYILEEKGGYRVSYRVTELVTNIFTARSALLAWKKISKYYVRQLLFKIDSKITFKSESNNLKAR